MKTNIVRVKYEDNYELKTFGGKAYSYYSTLDLQIGDLVIAPTSSGDKIARVSETDITEEKIADIKSYMKSITYKIDKEAYLQESRIFKEAA